MKIRRSITSFAELICIPVKRQWPFIILTTILIASSGHTIWHRTYPLVSHFESALLRYSTGIVVGYLLACILSAIKTVWVERTLRRVAIAACALLFLTEGIAFGQWNIHISPTLFCLFSETNSNEVCSVASILVRSASFWESVLTLIALLAGYFVLCRFKNRFALFSGNLRKPMLAISSMCISIAFAIFINHIVVAAEWLRADNNIEMQQFAARHNDYPDYTDNLTRLAFSWKALATTANGIDQWQKMQHGFLHSGRAQAASSDSLQIALIVGESFIRSHSSLYGYPLPTNPRLERMTDWGGNLVTFNNIISPQRNTSASLRTILSINADYTGHNWHNCVSVPALFKRAGFRIEMFDNQQTGNSSIYSFALGRFMFNPVMTNECYDAYFYSSEFMFDLCFLDTIEPLHNTDQHTLSFYHIAGQHLWATYPRQPQWEQFHAADIPHPDRPWLTDEKRQRIADYDNATYYNDSVVARIIQTYTGHNAVAIYFPDHGEEIYDYRDCALRKPPTPGLGKEYIDHIHRIPFFVWMSDGFIARHPDKAQAIRQSASRPGTLADVGQLLMGIAGIETPLYDPSRDLFSPHFIARPRLIERNNRPIPK